MTQKDLKELVREKYGEIARASDNQQSGSCCCGPSCCSPAGYTVFSESYSQLEGYNPDADLSLGCGIPTQYAGLKAGDHVLDLGSGAGNDCFVARATVGDTGHVTGIDFTEDMLLKAEENRKKLGYQNIEFIKGDIEKMPLPDNSFDVVLSNCVLNLVPDKNKAFSEIMRVLKPGGHFCVSDIVLRGELSDEMRADAELYAGCVAGASSIDDYVGYIKQKGFADIRIHVEKRIEMPQLVITFPVGKEESGIYSITLSASKPFIAS